MPELSILHASSLVPLEISAPVARQEIFIDIGSSTVKMYKCTNIELVLIKNQTIFFKDGFDPDSGIASENKELLISLIQDVQRDYPDSMVKAFATALFRTLSPSARNQLVNELYQKTGVILNIISQTLESFYLEKALAGHCTLPEPVMLINVGGGSTELVILQNQQVIARQNIDVGVGHIVAQFPSLNATYADVSLQEVIAYVRAFLASMESPVHVGFYSGGELTYMRCTDYTLLPNTMFEDVQHTVYVAIEDFSRRNEDVFHTLSLIELEQRMPENPKWMHGARACSAIVQAICEQYGVTRLIPSDANIMHGAVQQEFRTVTICGSFRKHVAEIAAVKALLEQKGVLILSPQNTEVENIETDFVMCKDTQNLSPLEVIALHCNAIRDLDAVIVCNSQGYVGPSTIYEIGYAHALGKRIICLEEPSEFLLRTLPIQVRL